MRPTGCSTRCSPRCATSISRTRAPSRPSPGIAVRRGFSPRRWRWSCAFARAGGLLVAGTDPTGYGGVVPGFANQRALELLVEAGFSAARGHPHRHAERRHLSAVDDRVGTIAPGQAGRPGRGGRRPHRADRGRGEGRDVFKRGRRLRPEEADRLRQGRRRPALGRPPLRFDRAHAPTEARERCTRSGDWTARVMEPRSGTPGARSERRPIRTLRVSRPNPWSFLRPARDAAGTPGRARGVRPLLERGQVGLDQAREVRQHGREVRLPPSRTRAAWFRWGPGWWSSARPRSPAPARRSRRAPAPGSAASPTRRRASP